MTYLSNTVRGLKDKNLITKAKLANLSWRQTQFHLIQFKLPDQLNSSMLTKTIFVLSNKKTLQVISCASRHLQFLMTSLT